MTARDPAPSAKLGLRRARLGVAAGLVAALLAWLPCARAEAKAVRLRLPASMPAGQRAALLAAAERGPDALRRYVWRTRIIYNHYLPDLVDGSG